MAEAAGLVLSVIGVAASFKACIELFDFIVAVRECNEEYEQLSALLGLQRLRFEIWGESVGLPSGRFDHEPAIPYNTQLDRPEIRPDIERALENIRNLLVSVTSIDSRYGVTTAQALEDGSATLRGTRIFQRSYDRLKNRLRKEQKGGSVGKAARWLLHDANQFKEAISRLTAFVDGLVQVTTTLGLLEERYEALRLHEEINTITNEEDLELLVDATSRRSASSFNRSISETASKRLMNVTGSIRSRCSDGSTYSFHSARTRPKRRSAKFRDPAKRNAALDALVESDNEDSGDDSVPPRSFDFMRNTTRSCAECEDSRLECSTVENIISCAHCTTQLKQCSFDLAGISSSMISYSAVSDTTPPREEGRLDATGEGAEVQADGGLDQEVCSKVPKLPEETTAVNSFKWRSFSLFKMLDVR